VKEEHGSYAELLSVVGFVKFVTFVVNLVVRLCAHSEEGDERICVGMLRHGRTTTTSPRGTCVCARVSGCMRARMRRSAWTGTGQGDSSHHCCTLTAWYAEEAAPMVATSPAIMSRPSC
jgi:hypothetical protein